MVGENWRYEEAFLRAAEIVHSGEIGEPVACHWAVTTPIMPQNKYFQSAWRRDGSFPGGFLVDGGVHHVAAMRLILGEIAEVTAQATLHDTGLPPADTLTAALRFENGALGSYTVTYAATAPWPPLLHHRHARRASRPAPRGDGHDRRRHTAHRVQRLRRR